MADVNEDNTKEDFEDDDFDDDQELNAIREKRIAEMRKQAEAQKTFLGKGHGTYREITEEDFIKEVTSSPWVVVHFYHQDFTRCKIVDKHLEILAKQHIEAKFLHIDVEKAPFFVSKLQVKVLPAIVIFKDGVADDRIVGFDELGGSDNFKTDTLAKRIATSGAIKFKPQPQQQYS